MSSHENKEMKTRKKGFLICFIGIDGSGKTTLAKMLVDTMNENGIRSQYLWCGWRQFEFFLLKHLARAAKRLRHSRQNSGLESDAIGEVRNPLYRCLILMDYVFSSVPKVRIPLALRRNVVCDRYVYDVVGGLLVNHRFMATMALRLFPRPDLIFLVDLPEEIAYQRKDDVPSVSYLKERKAIYMNMERRFKMTVIDGSKELGELRTVILSEVKKLMSREIMPRK